MYNSVYFLQYTSGSVSYNSVYSSKLRLKSCITLYSFFSILVDQLVTGLWIRFSLHLMKCILKIWSRQHVSNEWINGQYEWISWGYEWINKQFYGQIDCMTILNSQMTHFLKRTYIVHMKLVKQVCLIVLLNKTSTSTVKTASNTPL